MTKRRSHQQLYRMRERAAALQDQFPETDESFSDLSNNSCFDVNEHRPHISRGYQFDGDDE